MNLSLIVEFVEKDTTIKWKQAFLEMQWSIKYWTLSQEQQERNILKSLSQRAKLIPYFVSWKALNPFYIHWMCGHKVFQKNIYYGSDSEEDCATFYCTAYFESVSMNEEEVMKELLYPRRNNKGNFKEFHQLEKEFDEKIGRGYEWYKGEVVDDIPKDDSPYLYGHSYILLNNQERRLLYYDDVYVQR